MIVQSSQCFALRGTQILPTNYPVPVKPSYLAGTRHWSKYRRLQSPTTSLDLNGYRGWEVEMTALYHFPLE